MELISVDQLIEQLIQISRHGCGDFKVICNDEYSLLNDINIYGKPRNQVDISGTDIQG